MGPLLQLVLNGLALGSIYALIALGFVIVYTATGVVNFAAGEFVMIGTFLAVSAIVQAELPLSVSYVATLFGMAIFGLLFYALVFLPLQRRPTVTVIIGTVAAGIVIQNTAALIWGNLPFRLPSPFSGQLVTIAGSIVPVHQIAILCVTAVLVIGLYFLLYRSVLGSSMRATAQDVETARLMGIAVDRVLAFSWVLAALLAGVAGLLLGPVWFADVNVGGQLALKAFAATIIGGFGSIPGAILGGLFVGLTEILGASFISSTYKDGFSFLLMLLFLLMRPQGIFGERVADRG
ncbi:MULTISPECIES: branched-chain amino acid ABC transporter permease [Bradyrhizobium]|uniref:branched-chain amino acid ABC transporter permease n=1 Tax=Bradyrhizobium TaxID=374 RepID=UPI000488DB89|nr:MULTISPECIES: branched-chain amino acid ABC transporter permease [Bradyrhizobium]UFW51173.1 branched-chain amino acid ABC transporter permease [Bradyrhizobium arachidis]